MGEVIVHRWGNRDMMEKRDLITQAYRDAGYAAKDSRPLSCCMKKRKRSSPHLSFRKLSDRIPSLACSR